MQRVFNQLENVVTAANGSTPRMCLCAEHGAEPTLLLPHNIPSSFPPLTLLSAPPLPLIALPTPSPLQDPWIQNSTLRTPSPPPRSSPAAHHAPPRSSPLQDPWIQNSTLRSNILMGNDFDAEAYTEVRVSAQLLAYV